MAAEAYTGPVCYVGHDHEAADGRPLRGGWHYTVVDAPDGYTMPGEPLFLDHETGEYRLAVDGDQSWHERHHQRHVEIVPNLSEEEKERLRKLLEAQK